MDPHDYDSEEEGENAEWEFYTVEERTQFSGTVNANGGPVLQGRFAAGGNINVNHVTQQQESTVRTVFNRAVDVFGGAVIVEGVRYTYKAVNGDKPSVPTLGQVIDTARTMNRDDLDVMDKIIQDCRAKGKAGPKLLVEVKKDK